MMALSPSPAQALQQQQLLLYLPPPPLPEVMAPNLFFKPNRPIAPAAPAAITVNAPGTNGAANGAANGNQGLPMTPGINAQQPGATGLMPPQPSAPPALPAPAALGLNPLEKEKPALKEDSSKLNASEVGGMHADTIRNINARLESFDPYERMMAAADFSKLVMASPALATDPDYAPYTHALMLKILKDTDASVHEPALLLMQCGYYTNPSPAELAELQALKQEDGLFGFEGEVLDETLGGLARHQKEVGLQQSGLPPAGNAFTQAKNAIISKKEGMHWPFSKKKAAPPEGSRLNVTGV